MHEQHIDNSATAEERKEEQYSNTSMARPNETCLKPTLET